MAHRFLFAAALLTTTVAVAQDPPPATETLIEEGRKKARTGDFEGAIEDFNAALDIDPKCHGAYVGRGGCKYRKDDHVGAVKDLDMALLLKPGDASVYYMRGKIKSDFGDLKGALADLNDALLLQPSGYLHMEIANLKRANKDVEGAIAAYDKALETVEGVNRSDTFIFRGIAKADGGDLKAALADMAEAVTVSPGAGNVYVMRGMFRELNGDREGAVADFKKATEIGKNRVSRLWLGALVGDTKALKVIEKAPMWPGPVARYLLGLQDEAETLADAAKTENPRARAGRACEAHCYMGINFEREGKLELAKEHYRKSLATKTTIFLEYDWCRYRLRQLGEKVD